MSNATQTVDLASWDDYPAEIAKILGQYGTRTVEGPDSTSFEVPNEVIFRGQADSKWLLETTLERATSSAITVEGYLSRVDRCVHHIESLTGRKWDWPYMPAIRKEIREIQ